MKRSRVSAFSVYKSRDEEVSSEAKSQPPALAVENASESADTRLPVVSQTKLAGGRSRKRIRKEVKASRKKKRKLEAGVVESPDSQCLDAASDSQDVSTREEQTAQSSEVENTPFLTLFKPEVYSDSREAARELFKLLISPLPVDTFFSEVWEKRPVILRRHRPHYNEGWFSTEELDAILRECHVEFGTNIDLTTYEDGKRRTHNPQGRAMPAVVWKHFKEGCSVRLLNPQTFSKTVWKLNSTLQELFNCGVGANTYLTPAGSQGFAPHYDDIEAFVMQLEGRKSWRLYNPRNDQEILPRFSSGNFTESDLGDPVMEVVLEPGDLLYFPRGFIHQACTPSDTHSLHITVSTYQLNSWGDLLEKLLPAALEVAMTEEPELRAGLPPDFLNYTGIVHSDSGDPRRGQLSECLSRLFSKLLQHAPVDAAADQLGARYIHEALPPCPTEGERGAYVGGGGARWQGGQVVLGEEGKWTGQTRVRLFRGGSSLRLVMEKEATVLYSCLHNSRRPQQEREAVGIELQDEEAPVVDYLIKSYPKPVSVDSLPYENGSTQKKISLCKSLYQHGLLVIFKK